MSELKAYVVTDGDEGWAVVFGKTNGHARRLGAAQIGCEFGEIESCRRAPGFDGYAGQDIPLDAYLANGWRYECSNCGEMFELQPADDRLDDEGFPLDPEELVPVEDSSGFVYCCEACRMAGHQEMLRQRRREAATIEAVVTMFPGAIKIQSYVSFSKSVAYFGFPGGSGQAKWEVGGEMVSVDQRDVDAFNAWKSAGYPVEMN